MRITQITKISRTNECFYLLSPTPLGTLAQLNLEQTIWMYIFIIFWEWWTGSYRQQQRLWRLSERSISHIRTKQDINILINILVMSWLCFKVRIHLRCNLRIKLNVIYTTRMISLAWSHLTASSDTFKCIK